LRISFSDQQTSWHKDESGRARGVKFEILNASVVVLAKHHNPTILHPSFLSSEGIVPSGWEIAEPPVSTPVFAMVKYKNGIVFNVDENKFQVGQNEPKDDIGESQVPALACKYVQKLPHVRYQAVGINFKGFIERAKPERLVMDRFLKPGIADFDGKHPEASGFRFVYHLDHVRWRLSFDSGKVKVPPSEHERNGILIDANYHTDLAGHNVHQEIEAATSLYAEHYNHFIKATQSILALEGS
jgi:hypothetical protein